MGTSIEFKRLARVELSSVAEIDRTERIDLIYEQRGTELEERRGNWSSAAWDPHGHGEHSVEAQRHALEHYVDAGGIALGAFSNGRLVGIGVVVPHLRPEIAQLAFLHVSAAFRATGIGRRLSDELDLIARDAGDTEIVVSATPSENTVRFYMSRGYELMAQALPELYRTRARGRAHEKGALSADATWFSRAMARFPTDDDASRRHTEYETTRDALVAALPPAAVLTDPTSVERYAHDEAEWAPFSLPIAVVRPTLAAEVQSVVRICIEHRRAGRPAGRRDRSVGRRQRDRRFGRDQLRADEQDRPGSIRSSGSPSSSLE